MAIDLPVFAGAVVFIAIISIRFADDNPGYGPVVFSLYFTIRPQLRKLVFAITCPLDPELADYSMFLVDLLLFPTLPRDINKIVGAITISEFAGLKFFAAVLR